MTIIPAEVMREAYDAEIYRWGLYAWSEHGKFTHRIQRCDGDPDDNNAEWKVIASFTKFTVAEKAFELLSKEYGHRAALRALSAQFNDPVVKSALLAAAEEGEATK